MQEYTNNLLWNDKLKIITPRYGNRKTTQNDKQISPWNNDQYKKIFQPQQYLQTINHTNKRQQNNNKNYSKSLSITNNHHTLGNKISKDFIQLVKHQKKGAYLNYQQKKNQQQQLKMNLINVFLQENTHRSYDRQYSQTINDFYQNKSISKSDKSHKEQPVRVRIFKKNLQKKRKIQAQNERISDYRECYELEVHLPELKTDSNNLYHAMPRRTPKLGLQRRKIQSNIQFDRQYFPQLNIDKTRSIEQKQDLNKTGFFCRGQIIGKSDIQSKRKMKYRQFQIQDSKLHKDNIVFLQQFESSN